MDWVQIDFEYDPSIVTRNCHHGTKSLFLPYTPCCLSFRKKERKKQRKKEKQPSAFRSSSFFSLILSFSLSLSSLFISFFYIFSFFTFLFSLFLSFFLVHSSCSPAFCVNAKVRVMQE